MSGQGLDASSAWALLGLLAITATTLGIGVWGSRRARVTSDFVVAGRLVRAERNAAAISGEYLSAASFLGIAGLVLKDGADALWYPIGFTAGYLALLLFVAAPLRRSGAYTLPDFVEARLDSRPLRRLATVLVVLIGWLYLVPQVQGAGLTLSTVTGIPFWGGALVVVAIVLGSVLSGGMRAITLVQAFQYWVKLFAITVPAFVLLGVFLADTPDAQRSLEAPAPPTFQHATTVHVETETNLHVTEPTRLHAGGTLVPAGEPGGGDPNDAGGISGRAHLAPGHYHAHSGTELTFAAGSAVPAVDDAVADNASWLRPSSGHGQHVYQTYSLLIATFLGTMGLPHVLVRFYTNPSGDGARRTTLFVLVLLGAFYLFPTILGMLSRLYAPRLLVTGGTDAAVLMLPSAMLPNWAGTLLGAITAAGAFAAFLSTSSGLVLSIAGVLSTDLLSGRARDFRLVALLAAVVPAALAMSMRSLDIAQSVGLAFAMAASTFCPLLVLGVWWRGLTAAGAASGLLVGGGLTSVAVVLTVLTGGGDTVLADLLVQPAAISVPAAFATMIAVSKATRLSVPHGVGRTMLRMHAPDRLGFLSDRSVRAGGPAAGLSDSAQSSEQHKGRHRRE